MKKFFNQLFILTILFIGLFYGYGSYIHSKETPREIKQVKALLKIGTGEDLGKQYEQYTKYMEEEKKEDLDLSYELFKKNMEETAVPVIEEAPILEESSIEPITPEIYKSVNVIITDVRNNNIDKILETFKDFKNIGLAFNYNNSYAMEKAKDAGFDNLINTVVMEPFNSNIKLPLEAITTNKSVEENLSSLQDTIDKSYMPIAVINEMGSKITSENGDKELLKAILNKTFENNLLFIDSKSNFHSIACEVAEEYNIPCVQNYLFINKRDQVKDAFAELKAEATRNGSAIGIFTYDVNKLDALRRALEEIGNGENLQIVPIIDLIK